jgi:hypothetical protein
MARSKDPKTRVVSLKEFLESNDFLCSISKSHVWTDSTIPEMDKTYYQITGEKFVRIDYSDTLTNFGTEYKEKLEGIMVADRDGITEYQLFDAKIRSLQKQAEIHKRSALIPARIKQLERVKKRLPPFTKKEVNKPLPFSAGLHQTGYRGTDPELAKKYVVFDVETNGVRKKADDLLSLSIYDPETGICYNHFFPLDVQPVVLTTRINGITESGLKDATHLSQDDIDQIIQYFNLKNRILLSYSGGKGLFDPDFVKNYSARHHLTGFEQLTYENIKSLLPAAPFGYQGSMSKDELCSILGIEGVRAVHSGENDCVLEWKLFEKIGPIPLLCLQERLYQYDKNYIVPVTYLPRHPELVKVAQIRLPSVRAKLEPVFQFDFPDNVLKKIRKFPTNVTGIAIENAIDAALKAEEEDNSEFLIENRRHLKYLGSLMAHPKEIPVLTEDDGTLRAVEPQDETFIAGVNDVTAAIMSSLSSTIGFIRNQVFANEKILSQEMVISDDKKVLALCDLSSGAAVMEIKTFDVVDEKTEQGSFASAALTNQLYYEKRGRTVYVFSLTFTTFWNAKTSKQTVTGLSALIYRVSFVQIPSVQPIAPLAYTASRVLKTLETSPCQTLAQLASLMHCSPNTVAKGTAQLEQEGYIERTGTKRRGGWRILKDEKGTPLS